MTSNQNNQNSKECQICYETFTEVKRKPFECPGCHERCCVTCLRTTLLSRNEDTKCPFYGCNVAYTHQFLSEYLPKIFFTKEWRDHRRTILLDREKSKLVDYQTTAAEVVEQRKVQGKIKILQTEKKRLREMLAELDDQIDELRGGVKKERERKVFVMRCPGGGPEKECRGFLSEKYECGACGGKACSKCLCLKVEGDDEHECDDEALKSAKTIRKECVNCPKCAAPIFRIEGCYQMFCVTCHTRFDWKTGQILSDRNFHNPHYMEWLRNREDVDEMNEMNEVNEVHECDGIPDPRRFRHFIREYLDEEEQNIVYDATRVANHLRGVTIGKYTFGVEAAYRKVGVQYLLKDIDEDKWQKRLFELERKDSKWSAIREAINFFISSISDLLRRVGTNVTVNKASIKEIKEVRKLTNTILLGISSRYSKCVVPKIVIHENSRWTVEKGKA